MKKLAIIIISLILALMAGCSAQPAERVIPILTELSFTLSVEPPQEYAEYTIPIYIRSHQTLHLHWQIVQGHSFWMGCTTPTGELIGARVDGDFNIHAACEELIGMGTSIFSPSDPKYGEAADKLGEGYYLFHPNINKENPPVTIKIQYWIED